MEKTENTPLWVFLAFASIETKTGAVRLIWASVLFTFYCIPWALLFTGQDWISTVFLIEDWSWVAMMVPIVIWYWLGMSWVDRNSGWTTETAEQE